MTQSNKHSKFRRFLQWCVAAWNSVPYVEHHRNHLTSEAKQLRTTITFLSVYLLAAVVNFILAISLPGIYSMKMFNIMNGGVIGGIGGTSFGFVIACCAVFHKVIAERRSNRTNHINVAILHLLAAESEDLPGHKTTVIFRDYSIPDKNCQGNDVCKLMVDEWLNNFYACLNSAGAHGSIDVHQPPYPSVWEFRGFAKMNQTKDVADLADMFQGHLETNSRTQS